MPIRRANSSDLPQLMAIAEASGSAAHWTPQQWRDIFHTQIPARLAWLADESPIGDVPGEKPPAGNVPKQTASAKGAPCIGRSALAIGFLVAQCGSPEWELENIAVLPEFRRCGVGAALLSALLDEARARQADRILLEVRLSNRSAIRLYEQGGFQPLARRCGYYQNPAEDALILVRTL